MTDKKVNGAYPCFTLKLGNDIINDPTAVSNAFNDSFSTVADHIGTAKALVENESIGDIIKAYDSHESIVKIRSHINCDIFFYLLKKRMIMKFIHYYMILKATGYDGIPPKMLKISAHELCKLITDIINLSIKASRFPKQLKLAEVSPLFKIR